MTEARWIALALSRLVAVAAADAVHGGRYPMAPDDHARVLAALLAAVDAVGVPPEGTDLAALARSLAGRVVVEVLGPPPEWGQA